VKLFFLISIHILFNFGCKPRDPSLRSSVTSVANNRTPLTVFELTGIDTIDHPSKHEIADVFNKAPTDEKWITYSPLSQVLVMAKVTDKDSKLFFINMSSKDRSCLDENFAFMQFERSCFYSLDLRAKFSSEVPRVNEIRFSECGRFLLVASSDGLSIMNVGTEDKVGGKILVSNRRSLVEKAGVLSARAYKMKYQKSQQLINLILVRENGYLSRMKLSEGKLLTDIVSRELIVDEENIPGLSGDLTRLDDPRKYELQPGEFYLNIHFLIEYPTGRVKPLVHHDFTDMYVLKRQHPIQEKEVKKDEFIQALFAHLHNVDGIAVLSMQDLNMPQFVVLVMPYGLSVIEQGIRIGTQTYGGGGPFCYDPAPYLATFETKFSGDGEILRKNRFHAKKKFRYLDRGGSGIVVRSDIPANQMDILDKLVVNVEDLMTGNITAIPCDWDKTFYRYFPKALRSESTHIFMDDARQDSSGDTIGVFFADSKNEDSLKTYFWVDQGLGFVNAMKMTHQGTSVNVETQKFRYDIDPARKYARVFPFNEGSFLLQKRSGGFDILSTPESLNP
jgi:hypothetical protein